jgi:hypothetical protein
VKRFIIVALIFFLASTIWLGKCNSLPSEPVWRGHSLSQWLDAYRTNLSFPDETPPRSGFSDEEIAAALNGIGDQALPFLMKWLQIKTDNVWRWNVNVWLFRTGLLQFFNDVPEATDRQNWAVDGFLFYGTNALSLLPKLEKLTQNHNPDMRMVAYEAAFFTRPPKELFIPIADRALKEKEKGNQEMAAEWMAERFPDEADKLGLRNRYPQFFLNSTNNFPE